MLDDVIRTTNRRVNALEYVLLPRLDNTISYIGAELDEQDREEFFRLKKIQGKKKRDKEAADEGAGPAADGSEPAAGWAASILDAGYDPDVFV